MFGYMLAISIYIQAIPSTCVIASTKVFVIYEQACPQNNVRLGSGK